MGRIKEETVQRIFDTVDVVDVISDFVTLKKKGANYTGLCPFHNEKTPSFTVSPSKGVFKCFGCQEAGNALTFIKKVEGLSHVEALRYLAKKYNIQITEEEETEEDIQRRSDRESMFVVTNFAAKYFMDTLHKSKEGRTVGLSYFKERHFRDDIIKKFELGYSLENGSAFTQEALSKGYKKEYLEKTGLTITREGRSFDRFRGRVMFPIHSLTGKIVGFGGRTLKKDDKTAKYLNSPESEIYHKSSVLYGIYQAKKALTKNDKCYLVEGYTDLLAFHQAGIENVVATSGTALTEEQIRIIRRFTYNLTFIYDGDEAGVKASLRGFDLVLEAGMNIKAILLPEGEDPDSYAKQHNSSELQEFLKNNEKDIIEFKSELLLKNTENDPVKRSEAFRDIAGSLASIPNDILRQEYVKHVSQKLEITEDALHSEIGKIRYQKAKKSYNRKNVSNKSQKGTTPAQPETQISVNDSQETLEREIIKVLLKYGNQIIKVNPDTEKKHMKVAEFIISEMEADDLEIKNDKYKKLYDKIVAEFKEKHEIKETNFTLNKDEDITQIAVNFLANPYSLSKFWERGDNIVNKQEIDINRGVPQLIMSFKSKKVDRMMENVEKELKKAKEESNEEKELELLNYYNKLKKIQLQLSKELGDRVFIL